MSYTYDANGNTITRGADTFTYDSQNRLISATVGGTTAAYTYNFLNQRTSKKVGSTTTLYVYGPAGELLAEVDGATGDTLREYVWLDEVPLAFVDASGVYQIHTDHLGTPIALTDSVGLAAWQADYEPFGSVTTTGAVEFNLRMPGQYFDAESGLHYNWNRYYDPATGRYLSYDPIGLEGGINPYLYAVANPLKYFDSEGTAVDTAWDAYNVAVGINQTYLDLQAGNYSDAVVSGLATCGDVIAAAIPGIPGGFSLAVKSSRAIDDVLPLPGRRNLPFNDPVRIEEINKTLDRIEAGGPFPYKRDNLRWKNKEELLPQGNYREFTVDTPGATDRAKRRIVKDLDTGATYYTDDHYKTFIQIDPVRR